jgi:hypothetical protein
MDNNNILNVELQERDDSEDPHPSEILNISRQSGTAIRIPDGNKVSQ